MKKPYLLLIVAGVFFLAGCKKNPSTSLLPTLATATIDSIAISTAVSGGTISNDGGTAITARGIVWGTNSNPTTALPTKTTDGTGTGGFASKIVGLTAKTTYYVRAYATNSNGTGYGNEISFVTLSPVTLASVTIGTQIWTSTNLNVATYKNGDIIPKVTDPAVWSKLTTGAWCWYNNDSAAYSGYGKLYNWYAVNDSRGLAPLGWHIPSDDESATLGTFLGGDGTAGGALKESGLTHWTTPNTGATNTSGFIGLPGGNRDVNGNFNNIGKYGSFWNATQFDGGSAWFRYMSYSDGILSRYYREKTFGYSVRCVKD